MGLLNVITSSINQTANNMYKGFYTCDSLSSNTLVKRGMRHHTAGNTIHGDPNIITNGSIICVADGQAAIVVLNGRIKSIYTEAGEYELTEGGNSTLFAKDGLKETTHTALRRVEFGGEYAGDQRLYYVNTKEILSNKFATTHPIPIRIHDVPGQSGLNVKMHISGVYSMRITRPDILYKNVTGNVIMSYSVSQLATQIRAELDTEMYSISGRLAEKGINVTDLPSLTKIIGTEIQQQMNEFLEPLRGISITHIAISSIAVDSSDDRLIRHLQETKIYAGSLAAMATRLNAGSVPVGSIATSNTAPASGNTSSSSAGAPSADKSAPSGAGSPSPVKIIRLKWTCVCGKENTGKFCEECGEASPVWTCSCGKENTGKFCEECGAKKIIKWTCSCGKENTGKFCEECGKAAE